MTGSLCVWVWVCVWVCVCVWGGAQALDQRLQAVKALIEVARARAAEWHIDLDDAGAGGGTTAGDGVGQLVHDSAADNDAATADAPGPTNGGAAAAAAPAVAAAAAAASGSDIVAVGASAVTAASGSDAVADDAGAAASDDDMFDGVTEATH